MNHLELAIIHIEDAIEFITEGDEAEIAISFLREALKLLEIPDEPAGEKGCPLCFPSVANGERLVIRRGCAVIPRDPRPPEAAQG
jgi:hypothetical protein